MSAIAMNWAAKQPYRGVAKSLLNVLARASDDFGASWKSNKTLALESGCSPRTVAKTLQLFEADGTAVRINRRNSYNGDMSNVVLLKFPGRKIDKYLEGAVDKVGAVLPSNAMIQIRRKGGMPSKHSISNVEKIKESSIAPRRETGFPEKVVVKKAVIRQLCDEFDTDAEEAGQIVDNALCNSTHPTVYNILEYCRRGLRLLWLRRRNTQNIEQALRDRNERIVKKISGVLTIDHSDRSWADGPMLCLGD